MTASVARALDDDLAPLSACLAGHDIAHAIVDWDDPDADWGRFDLVVVRSPWDYTQRYEEFLAWAGRVDSATVLANPLGIIRWSTDKRYMGDLAIAGVPVVATSFAAPGEPMDWPDSAEVVVKPTISAGSLDTERYPRARLADAAEHLERLHAAGRVAMAQPYLSAVEDRGETALVFIDGRFSHALRKGPMLMPGLELVGGLYVEEDIRATEATAPERAVADAALAAIPGGPQNLLYARVDLIPDDRGRPVVLELELVEPSLFLAHADGAAERLVDAIATRLRSSASARG